MGRIRAIHPLQDGHDAHFAESATTGRGGLGRIAPCVKGHLNLNAGGSPDLNAGGHENRTQTATRSARSGGAPLIDTLPWQASVARRRSPRPKATYPRCGHKRARFVRVAGAGSAIGGAILLAILAWTETALGPAQDMSQGGAGDPARIAFSISLVVWAFAGFTIALLSLGFGLRRSTDPGWPLVALGIAAALFALSGAMLGIGWMVGWQPAVPLGVVNVPALLLLVSGWVGVGQMSRRTYGSGWRGILPLGQLGLGAALFVTTATGGPLVIVVEAVFVVGWIAIATLIWSGYGSHDPVDIDGKQSDSS